MKRLFTTLTLTAFSLGSFTSFAFAQTVSGIGWAKVLEAGGYYCPLTSCFVHTWDSATSSRRERTLHIYNPSKSKVANSKSVIITFHNLIDHLPSVESIIMHPGEEVMVFFYSQSTTTDINVQFGQQNVALTTRQGRDNVICLQHDGKSPYSFSDSFSCLEEWQR